MKKFIAFLLVAVMAFNIVSCNRSEEGDSTETTAKEAPKEAEAKYSFITQSEKNTWRSKIVAALDKAEVPFEDSGMIYSFGAGLMDINFDGVPEVLAAYPGGSMGNVFVEIYDLADGEKICSYNATHWDEWNNIYLCIADKKGEYVVLTEGSWRIPDLGFVKQIGILPENMEPQQYIIPRILFAESVDEEIGHYEYNGKKVSKYAYDALYEQFLVDYKKIESTQLKLIKWNSLSADSRDGLIEQMADALINSPQEFLDK